MPDIERLSWAEIGRISDGGDAPELLGLGSTKTEHLKDGTSVVFQTVDFGHDELPGGGFAPVTWEMQHVLPKRRCINRNGDNDGGWEQSDIRRWLNRDFYTLLSDELQSIIKPVIKRTSAGHTSSDIVQTEDKLWLPSEVEVFGRTEYSHTGEGSQYQYHCVEGRYHRKFTPDVAQAYWWLRSPYRSHYGFCFVDTDGSSYYCAARHSFGFAAALAT